MSIKHLKVSAKADGPDPGNVHASDWNAAHDLSALIAQDVSDFAEAVDDRVAALLKQGTNVTLTYDDAANTLTIAASGGGTPGGATTQVQFNDGGVFAGDADLTWDKTANALTLNGTLKGASNIAVQPGANGNIQLDGGRGVALATAATSGYVTSPSTGGTPTGIPANVPTGSVATVFDTTGLKPWYYVPNTGDASYASVSALLYGYGANNAAVFTDEKGSAWTPVAGGAPVTSTSWGFVGQTSSIKFTNGGIKTPGTAAFDVPIGDFTIEFFARFITAGAAQVLANKGATTGYFAFQVYVDAANAFWFRCFDSSDTLSVSITGGSMVVSTDYFISARRSGSTFTLHVNNVLIGSATFAGALRSAAENVVLGSYDNDVAPAQCYMGQFRFTKGIARPTTVPTTPFVNTAGNGGWTTLAGGAKTTIDDTAPATPAYGDRWIKPSNMTEMVWVPNAGQPGIWINPADAAVALQVAYPIAINKGGTGATDAATALLNLGGVPEANADSKNYVRRNNSWFVLPTYPVASATVPKMASVAAVGTDAGFAHGDHVHPSDTTRLMTAGGTMTGVLALSDGTVAAPGLAFNSEPGLGWYRSAAGLIKMVASGAQTFVFDAASAVSSSLNVVPQTSGIAQLLLRNSNTVNYNQLVFQAAANGSASIATAAGGSATRGNLTLDAPAVFFTGGATIPSILELGNSSGAYIDMHALSGTDYEVRLNVDPAAANKLVITSSQSNTALQISGGAGGWFGQNISGGLTNPVAWAWTGGHVGCRVDSSQVGVFAWLTDISDMRFKKDIEPLPYGLDTVLEMNPIQYEFDHEKSDYMPKGLQYGLSAQEMQKLVPLAVSTLGDGEDQLRINYRLLTPILINAIKTLHARVQQLEAQA